MNTLDETPALPKRHLSNQNSSVIMTRWLACVHADGVPCSRCRADWEELLRRCPPRKRSHAKKERSDAQVSVSPEA
jgi:hypothetical protein